MISFAFSHDKTELIFSETYCLWVYCAEIARVPILPCKKANEIHALQETERTNLPSTRHGSPTIVDCFSDEIDDTSVFPTFFSKIKEDDFPFSSNFSSDKSRTSYTNQETTEQDKPTKNRAPKLMKQSRCSYRQIRNFEIHETGIFNILSFCVLMLFGDCLEP